MERFRKNERGDLVDPDAYRDLLKDLLRKADITENTQYYTLLMHLVQHVKPLLLEYMRLLQFCAVCDVGSITTVLGKVEDFKIFLKDVVGIGEFLKASDHELMRLLIAIGSAVHYFLSSKFHYQEIDASDPEHKARLWSVLKPRDVLVPEFTFLKDPTSGEGTAFAIDDYLILDYKHWYVLHCEREALQAKTYPADKITKVIEAARRTDMPSSGLGNDMVIGLSNTTIEEYEKAGIPTAPNLRRQEFDLIGSDREEVIIDPLGRVTTNVTNSVLAGNEVKYFTGTKVLKFTFGTLTIYVALLFLFIGVVFGACPTHPFKYVAKGREFYYSPAKIDTEHVGVDCEEPQNKYGCIDHTGRSSLRCQKSCTNGTWERFCVDVTQKPAGNSEGMCNCGIYRLCTKTEADFSGFRTTTYEKIPIENCDDVPHKRLSISELPQSRHLRSIDEMFEKKREEENCIVYFSLEGKSITVKSATKCLIQVRIEKGVWFEEHDYYCPVTISHKLPEVVFESNGVLRILAVLPSGQIVRNSFQINSEDYCPDDPCFLCSDTFNRVHCGGYLRSAALFFLLCILMSCLILLSYNFFRLSLCLTKGTWSTFRFVLQVARWASKSETIKNIKTKIKKVSEHDPESPNLEKVDRKSEGPKDGSISLRELLNRGSKVSIRGNALMILMCVMVCVPTTIACDGNALVITATTETCVVSGVDTEDCTAAFEIDAIMSFKNSEVCFTLVSQNNHTYLNGKILYKNTHSTISLEQLYVTSFWSGYSESRHRCYDSGPCDAGSCHRCCTDKTADGQLSDPNVINYPGHSRCRRSCGCATCGCFLCDDSCVFSGFGIVPTANKYYVKVSNGQVWEPQIVFSITDANTTQTFEVSGDGTVVSVGGLDFAVDLLQKPTPAYFPPDGRKFVVESASGWTYCEFASEVNAPQRGVIGDIQGNLLSDFTSPNANSFIFAEDVYTISQQSKLDSYTFEDSGVYLNGLKNRLPRIISGDLWDSNGAAIWSDLNNPGPIRAVVTTPGTGYKFVRKVALVCPQSSLVNASGCYSCQQGAVVVIDAKSSCGEGLAFVKVDDPAILVSTPSVSLTSTETTITIEIETNDKENEFTMYIVGNGGNSSFIVRFTADFDPIVRNDSTYTNDTSDPDDSGGGIPDIWGAVEKFFKGIFNFKSKWWEYIIIVVVLIVLLIIFAVLVYFCWPIIFRVLLLCCGGMRKSQYSLLRKLSVKPKDK